MSERKNSNKNYSEYSRNMFVTNKVKRILFINIVIKYVRWNARHKAKQNCVP